MRIAIPVENGQLCAHFGHCERFAVLDVDEGTNQIAQRQDLTPPPHEPGVLPRWLGEMNVDIIIAGGMGGRAQQLFAQNQIGVIVGAPCESPEALAASYLAGTLQAGENICHH